MKLKGGKVRFGQMFLRPEDLAIEANRRCGEVLGLGLGAGVYTDKRLLTMLLARSTPVEIIGDGALILMAEFWRFPFRYRGENGFHAFGVRLSPTSDGGILSVALENPFSIDPYLWDHTRADAFEWKYSPAMGLWDGIFRNRSLHFQLCMEISNNLAPITPPPTTFGKEIIWVP